MDTLRLPQVHIRFNGISYDTDYADLDLTEDSNDNVIREAAARYLDAPASKLTNFVIDRNTETGDITIHPQAVFGN